MGTNSEESFTEVNEYGDVEDGVGVEVNQFQPEEKEEAAEEGAAREAKSALKEAAEDDLLVCSNYGKFIGFRGAPENKGLGGKNSVSN